MMQAWLALCVGLIMLALDPIYFQVYIWLMVAVIASTLFLDAIKEDK